MLDPAVFSFSEDLLAEISTFLHGSAGELSHSRPEDVGDRSFGAAPASLGCAGDASLARHHVVDAIVDMVAGLNGYRDAIVSMSQRAGDVDVAAHAGLSQQISRAQSCEAPTFASPSTCSLPTTSQDES